jgi:formylglycine-generating enzyme required for sulfatase activity
MGVDQQEADFAFLLCDKFISVDKKKNCWTREDSLSWSGIQDKVALPEFKIMDNEVTIAQYQQCIDSDGCQLASGLNYDKDNVNKPITGINWFEAGNYCKWLGGRLPTEGEWEKSANGPDSRNNYFPWGNTWEAENANLNNVVDGNVEDVTKYIDSDKSYYGIKNMAGNVREWTASESLPLDENPISLNQPLKHNLENLSMAVIVRGGSWINEPSEGMVSKRATDSASSVKTTLGFRCACPSGNSCISPWNRWWTWFGNY